MKVHLYFLQQVCRLLPDQVWVSNLIAYGMLIAWEKCGHTDRRDECIKRYTAGISQGDYPNHSFDRSV